MRLRGTLILSLASWNLLSLRIEANGVDRLAARVEEGLRNAVVAFVVFHGPAGETLRRPERLVVGTEEGDVDQVAARIVFHLDSRSHSGANDPFAIGSEVGLLAPIIARIIFRRADGIAFPVKDGP